MALGDAHEKAIAERQRAEGQYNAAGSALQSAVLLQLKRARKTFAESSLALLDFLDARDREALASHQEAISRIKTLLDERKQVRADLERLLRTNETVDPSDECSSRLPADPDAEQAAISSRTVRMSPFPWPPGVRETRE